MSSNLEPDFSRVSKGLFQAAPPVLTDGSAAALRLDNQGRLRVIPEAGPGGGLAQKVQGADPNGSPALGNPVLIGGQDIFGNAHTIAVDQNGKLEIRAILDSDIQLTVNDRITVFSNTVKDGTGVPLVPIVDSDGHSLVSVVAEQATATIGAAAPPVIKIVGGLDDFALSKAVRMHTDGTVRVDPTGQTVQPVNVVNPIVIAPGTGGSPLVQYNSAAAVAANIETTIVSFIVPPGQTLHLNACEGTGDIAGCRYTVYVNGALVMAKRTTVAEPNADLDFKGAQPLVMAGQIIQLKVTHFLGGHLGNFDGTILGTFS
jgi:hypothetical protein